MLLPRRKLIFVVVFSRTRQRSLLRVLNCQCCAEIYCNTLRLHSFEESLPGGIGWRVLLLDNEQAISALRVDVVNPLTQSRRPKPKHKIGFPMVIGGFT